MLLPLQGANPNIHRPRALPWAGCLLAFQAVTSQKLYRTPITRNTQNHAGWDGLTQTAQTFANKVFINAITRITRFAVQDDNL